MKEQITDKTGNPYNYYDEQGMNKKSENYPDLKSGSTINRSFHYKIIT